MRGLHLELQQGRRATATQQQLQHEYDIAAVRARLQGKEAIPLTDQPLTFTATEVIEMKVKTLTGQLLSLLVQPQDTVAMLKDKIFQQTGVEAEKQRLIYSLKNLEDDALARDCDFQPEKTLYLVFRLRGA
jgi:hypothetical protein